ncbi:MAG: hypothetical protein WB630_01880 [Candidatus Acidiferrales bacterium]
MAAERMAVLGVYTNHPAVDRAVGEFIAAGGHPPQYQDSASWGDRSWYRRCAGGHAGSFCRTNWRCGTGIGALLIAGPLFGAFAGATAGGAVGVLVGLGIPEDEAKLYEDCLKKGGILVSVHEDGDAKVKEARSILLRTGATDIATTHEATRSPMANEGIPKVVGR